MSRPTPRRRGQERENPLPGCNSARRYSAGRHLSRGAPRVLVAALRSGQASGDPTIGSVIARCDQGGLVDFAVSEGVAALSVAKRLRRMPDIEGVVRERTDGRLERRLLVGQLSDWVPGGLLPAGQSVSNGMIRSLRDGFQDSWHVGTIPSCCEEP